MTSMNVSLPESMKLWIKRQVNAGHYSSASDYVRDLIQQDQKYKNKRETLVRALIAGENSGVSKRMVGDIWEDVKARRGLGI